jgi:hypothetical protein
MAPLSFTIETKLSSDEVIDLVRGVSNTSRLTNTERLAIIRAFPASHWPKPNVLSTHADYGSLISFSRFQRTMYFGLIIPSADGGTKIIFGVDWQLLAIVVAVGLLFIILGLSKLPHVYAVFALAATAFVLIVTFFFAVNYTVERYRRLIHKMLNLSPPR